MKASAIFFGILVYVTIYTRINATHFEGGTITYKILNTSGSAVSIVLTQTYIYDYTKIYCNNSMIANQTPQLYFNPAVYYENTAKLNCIQNCNQSVGYSPLSVITSCTDYSVGLDITVGQRSDVINLTNGSYFQVAYQSLSWRQLSLPSGSGSSNTNWSVSCWIDLRQRSDGSYNQPPVATIMSPIYIPVGIRQVILIPTIDADNDQVRCRFANGTNECGKACPPGSLPNGTMILSNCTLIITGVTAGDWYAVAIEIEDFLNSTSTTPLSTVPVQFLINVRNASNCAIRPLLTGPASQSGGCVGIQVGQPYVIQLVAENYCPILTTIKDIATISFPIVIKTPIVQNTTTLWSISLTWIPTTSAIGSHVLCAVAIDSMNVQSNQYCMTFIVVQGSVPICPGQVATTVQNVLSTSGQVTTYTSLKTSELTSTKMTTTITNLPSVTTAQSCSTLPPQLDATNATVTNHLDLQHTVDTASTFVEPSTTSSTTARSGLTLSSSSSQSSPTLLSWLSTTSSTTGNHLEFVDTTYASFTSVVQSNTNTTSTSPLSLDTVSSEDLTMTINTSFETLSNADPNSNTTNSVIASSSSDSTSPLLWIVPLALILISLCLCCCCYCYPRFCLCCPFKRGRRRSSSDKLPQENNLIHPPIYPHIVDNTFENDPHIDDDIFHITRPSSVTSSRNADDIHLTALPTPRSNKATPHYTIAINRSPRVTPVSPGVNLFGTRQV